jgi:hypothetical protein
LHVFAVNGICDAGVGETLFNLSQGRASDGAEQIFRSDDCVALMVVSNTREPWTLSFELIE